MNQTYKKLPRIRVLLIVFGVAMAIIPAAIISTLLIATLQNDLEQKGYELSQFQANLLADRVSSELETLTARLSEVAADSDVSAAARSSVFSDDALMKIESALLDTDLDSGAIIFDKNRQLTEATPVEWLLLDEEFFHATDIPNASESNDIRFELLSLPNPSKESEQLEPTLVFYIPLHLQTLIEAPASTNTGTLALLRPVSSIVNAISDNAIEASLLSLTLNDINIYRSSALPSGFIRNESTRTINEKLKISVEMGVPFAPIKNQIEQYTVRLIYGLIAALIVISVISFIGIWRLLAPYREVTETVEKLSQGNYQQIDIKPVFQEPAQIIDLLNVLQRRVIRDQSELEHLVEERTKQLLSANMELENTLEEVRNLQEHLVESEKNAQLGKLVAGVAHEINTPLGNCMTAMSVLSEHITDLESKFGSGKLTSDEMKLHLEACTTAIPLIENNLQRSATLVRTFKEVSVENVCGNKREIFVKQYLEEVITTLHSEIVKYQVSFEINGDETLIINTDASAIGRVFSQLILNSLKHGFTAQDKHHITINYRKIGTQLELSYMDDGKGADDEALENMFNPFYTTGRHSGHTGLGLHIVYNIVCQKLNGSIKVTRVGETKGLLFNVIFPVNNEV
ncbi:HAMP domain-containing sensor histidine kinase [Vibrio hannami]|uniref:sensor histidine kinase n=1 Tax=Vibrio hannami TaxID=2717094 RepID=UPI00240F2079|nr:HAMP domain-containing sensor histidine kinase [Vibrio hannami]MDG3086532.1 HAMP domain-containing sensor histidine kinase [Vibrio hannami]